MLSNKKIGVFAQIFYVLAGIEITYGMRNIVGLTPSLVKLRKFFKGE